MHRMFAGHRRLVAVALACLAVGDVAGLAFVGPRAPRRVQVVAAPTTSTTAVPPTSSTTIEQVTTTVAPTARRAPSTEPRPAQPTTVPHVPPSAAGSIVFISRKFQPQPTSGPVTPSSEGYNVWIMAADGRDARQLTFTSGDAQPALSPDGRYVAWVVGDRELWVMGSDASQPHKLVACPFDCQEPRWSPDGGTIAYVTVDASAQHRGSVATIGADGSGRRDYATSFDAYAVNWSPDGTQFVVKEYDHGGGLWIMNVGDGAAHQIRSENSGAPSWSPDGARILFSDGVRLQMITPAGSGLKQVSKGTRGQYLAGHWARDGHTIVFDFCCHDGKLEQVGAMNPDGTNERMLTDGRFESYESTF